MSDVSLRIPTSSLRALLDDKPDLLLQIESMACEKIAEEITRKTIQRDIGKMNQALQEAVRKELMKGWSGGTIDLSTKAKELVAFEVNRAVEKVIEATASDMVERLEKSVGSRMEARLLKKQEGWLADIKETLDERDAKLKEEVKTLAKTEFLGVMTDVRKAFGGT